MRKVPSDGELSARQTRFETLVLPHLDRLVAFATRHLGSVSDAEDVVQEACSRAWLGFEQLREETHLRAWLYQILRTTMSDVRDQRGRRERLAPMLPMGTDMLLPEDEPGPFEHLLATLSREKVVRLLNAIPEEFSVAVQLHDLEGFGYREIAEITGVPVGTVTSRIYRGRKLLATLVMTKSPREASERRIANATHPVERRSI